MKPPYKVWCVLHACGILLAGVHKMRFRLKFEETKCFFPVHSRLKKIIVGSLRDREVGARLARARISNSVSGGQCHIIYLAIHRRFSLPSLAYMCTGVLKPHALSSPRRRQAAYCILHSHHISVGNCFGDILFSLSPTL